MKPSLQSAARRTKAAPAPAVRSRARRIPKPAPKPGISHELIANWLRVMRKHIRSGRARQVFLHAIVIANILSLEDPAASEVRDMVSQAQGLFLRGNRRLAEQRLQQAIDHWCASATEALPAGPLHRHSGMAAAHLVANGGGSSPLSATPRLPKSRAARA